MTEHKCMMPHTNLEIHSDGTARICCLSSRRIKDENGVNFNIATATVDEIWTSPDRVMLAKQMDAELPQECHQCIELEQANVHSKRQSENTQRRHYIVSDVTPVTYDIKFGNICNLKCTMCGPWNSTKWIADWEILNEKSFSLKSCYDWPNSVDLISQIRPHLASIKQFEFYGGEPMLLSQHLELVKIASDDGYGKDISMRMNTNGTKTFSPSHLETYAKLQRTGLNWSIDSLNNAQFQYQRFPAKLPAVIANFDYVYHNREDNIDMTITPTINIMSVMYLGGIVEFLKLYPKCGIHLNILQHPDSLSIMTLDKNAAAHVIGILEAIDTSHLTMHSTTIDDIITMLKRITTGEVDGQGCHDKVIKYLDNLDDIRKTSWRNVFPELSAIIETTPSLIQTHNII